MPGAGFDPAVIGLAQELSLLLLEGDVMLACEPFAECVLGAVGLTYLAHAPRGHVRFARSGQCQPRLGERELALSSSEPLTALARRVFAGLERRVAQGCGRSRRGTCRGCDDVCLDRIVYACSSDDPGMPQAVLDYARLCFDEGSSAARMLSHPDVSRLESLARRVVNECEHTRQFARFSQLRDGTFFARISPNANTLPLVAGYFSARMGDDRFCLLDPAHRMACLHEPGSPCQVVVLDGPLVGMMLEQADGPSGEELAIQELWRTFYQQVSLSGRSPQERGYDLRVKWMPKRFWDGLPELAPRAMP